MCARCEFRSAGRLFCGPACAANAPPQPPLRSLVAASILALIGAAAGWRAMSARRPAEPPRQVPRRAIVTAPAPDARRFDPAGGSAAALVPASLPVISAAPLRREGRAFPPDLLEARPSAPSDRPIVLSFDAGASDAGALGILDALKLRSIRTTVFLTGEFIARYPWIARRVAEDGHEVGNHTFHHPHLTQFATGGGQSLRPGVTEEFLRDELRRTEEIFEKTTGRRMAPIWRAPFGEENPEIRAWAARAGYTHVSWTHGAGQSLDSLDWVSDEASPRYRSSRRVVDRLLAAARPGGIILMHLGSARRDDPVGREVPRLLDGLAAEGYRFARATEFLRPESAPR